jgi:hypothetical protein
MGVKYFLLFWSFLFYTFLFRVFVQFSYTLNYFCSSVCEICGDHGGEFEVWFSGNRNRVVWYKCTDLFELPVA